MTNKLSEILVEKKSMHVNLIVVFSGDNELGTPKTVLCILNLDLLF